MKNVPISVCLSLLLLALLGGCDYGKPGGEAKKASAGDSALTAPASSPGRMANDDGVGHFQQAHWDVASDYFRKAITADPNLAEAHYNLAVTLDKMGKHDEATASFKKAAELAPTKPEIKDSPILKKHIGM